MDNNGTIHERITQLVDTFGKGKNTAFASLIGSNEANVRGYKTSVMPKFDFLEKIARSLDINLKWLLTGEGSMLRDSKTSEETTMDYGTEKVQSVSSDAVTLRFMDKLDEKDTLLKDKESKIEHLQSELLAAREELATLKAKHPESSTAHPKGLGSSETAPHAPSHPHSPTSEHYHGGSCPPHQEKK